MGILKPLLRQQFHFWGGPKLYRARHKADVRILMYHNFPAETAGLRRQCEHIRRYYRPVSLKQIAEGIDGAPLPENAVAITIDDGYRDFKNAFAVFREFGIPATVYLVANFLDRKEWLWWNQIEYAIAHCARHADVQIAGKLFHIQPSSGALDEHTFIAVCETLKTLPNRERIESIQSVLRQLAVQIPAHLPEKWAPLTWDEVRQLARENVEFGAHTKTHPILSSISDADELKDEILGSKMRLEEELGRPVLHFCYPNGRNADIGPRALEVAREARFCTAVTTEPGMNRLSSATDRLQLKRLAASPDYPVDYFAELLAGVRSS